MACGLYVVDVCSVPFGVNIPKHVVHVGRKKKNVKTAKRFKNMAALFYIHFRIKVQFSFFRFLHSPFFILHSLFHVRYTIILLIYI